MPSTIDEPVVITGSTEPDATVRLDGTELDLVDGVFSVTFDYPPAAPVRLTAVDLAGNETIRDVVVPVTYPGTTGVHVTAAAWAHDELRQAVLDLVDAGQISVVQLDLKDEGGVVGYDSEVPLANEIGAVQPSYELEATIRDLHARGVRVIGRVVAFRDPILASAAWERGDRDWVIQNPSGEPLAAYDGFTNYVNDGVRAYNLAIAIEAAEAGIDEILWDYIRRPEGNPASMVVPGLEGLSSEHTASFLAESHEALRARGVYQGASVFGIAAARGDVIAQDIPTMARHTDYIAPMVYPSHWSAGEYDVADPIRQPYDIVAASLQHFQDVTQGTGAVIVPWLQAFSLGGVSYGPDEVSAQLDAAADLGIESWLLWNPHVRYESAAGSFPDRPG